LPKLILLTLLKESYLFLANSYGLLVHPLQTIIKIRRKPDWSQTVLVFGWPALGALGTLGIFIFGLIFIVFLWPTNENFINFWFLIFCLLFSIFSLPLAYFCFWLTRYFVWRKFWQNG
jgi:hypothetical protein